MPNNASIILDGTPAYGSVALVIDGVTYVCDDFNCATEEEEATDRTIVGAPQRRKVQRGYYKITGTMQLASNGTSYPAWGSTFSFTPKNESSKTFVVDHVEQPVSNDPGSFNTVPFAATEVKNPGSFSVIA